jgi:hypothetical protein
MKVSTNLKAGDFHKTRLVVDVIDANPDREAATFFYNI